MTAASSRALPFIAIGVGFFMAVMAVLGYGEQLESTTAFLGILLPLIGGGGLINKAIDASVQKSRTFLDDPAFEPFIKRIVTEVVTAKRDSEGSKPA
jgi:hypothetical protein